MGGQQADLGFWESFEIFCFDFLERFLESEWSHFGGSESCRKLMGGIFSLFVDFGVFWIFRVDFFNVFGIRMVTFWGSES